MEDKPILTKEDLKVLRKSNALIKNAYFPSWYEKFWEDFIRRCVRVNTYMMMSSVGKIHITLKSNQLTIKKLKEAIRKLEEANAPVVRMLQKFKKCPKCKGKQSPNPLAYNDRDYEDCYACNGHGYLIKAK